LAVGEQARPVDYFDESSSKPVVNIKFAIIRALNDAPLIADEDSEFPVLGTE
jgi:hypothetical protein